MSRVFNDHTSAFERLILLGVLPRDHIQKEDYDYSTDLKVELRKRDREEQEGKPVLSLKKASPSSSHLGKPLGKHVGKPKTPCSRNLGKPISVGQLLESRKNNEWIVDNFGVKGGLVLLAADYGTGKTTFLYSLASSITKGEAFLKDKDGVGQLTTKKCKVLYYQADEPKNDCWRKIKIMGLEPDAFHIRFGEDGFNILDLVQLERDISEGGFGAVLMDSVTTLLGNQGIDFKDPRFGSQLYELNQLASRLNVLIVITSHLRKPDGSHGRNHVTMHDVLGAGTQIGAVSDVWAIWRQVDTTPRECKFVLSCLEKARHCQAGTYWNLLGNQEDLSWTFDSVVGGELLPSVRKDLKTYAKEYLCESQEWRTVKDVATHFGKNEEWTRGVLMDLFVEDVLERKSHKLGLAVGGRPKWVYRGFPRSTDHGE